MVVILCMYVGGCFDLGIFFNFSVGVEGVGVCFVLFLFFGVCVCGFFEFYCWAICMCVCERVCVLALFSVCFRRRLFHR